MNESRESDARALSSIVRHDRWLHFAIASLIPLLVTSCGLPGTPSITVSAPPSPSQTACEEYAKSFFGTTRENIVGGLEAARNKLASQSQSDSTGTELLTAIDDVLVNSVVGTNESFLAANDRVIGLCSDIGVNITVE